ncbi:MAG: EVE domain-containing protein [Acidobacteriota bacterium]
MPYLLKSEPSVYSFDQFLADKTTTWDGIKNNQALIYLRNMKKGEDCIIYHSNEGKAAVGTAKVVSVELAPPVPPSKMTTPIVTLKAGKRLKNPKSLEDIRNSPVFKDSLLFRQFRLSVVPLTEAQYDWLLHG